MIKCPYCGKSHYAEGLSTCTAVYYQPIWKDGVNINPDRNQHTTWCTCLECNKEFIIVNGEAQKIEQPESVKPDEYVVVDYKDLSTKDGWGVTLTGPISTTPYVDNKPAGMYQVIANENELKWFFDHVIQKPQVNESYSMVFVSRHKKLTKEEQVTFGLTRKESEFLATQSIRLGRFKDALYIDEENNWTFDNFLKRVKRFNVDKGAYTTGTGAPLPEKTLAVIFYVNPCDDIKVADALVTQINDVKTAIAKAMLNGKTTVDNLQSYQMFGNLENNLKHLKANQKGTRYWLDFDIDVPAWWKDGNREINLPEITSETIGPARPEFFDDNRATVNYYEEMRDRLNYYFGKGNYAIVDTSGGYHILVRVSSIKGDPHKFCRDMSDLYCYALFCGETAYVDEKGNCKFECIVNDSQIPGLPLPGTYQYGRPVTVLNKEDFE